MPSPFAQPYAIPPRAKTHSLALESINSLDVSSDVVVDWLEVLDDLLGLVDNGLVLYTQERREMMSVRESRNPCQL